MLRPHPSEVLLLARALLVLPKPDRARRALQMLQEASLAEAYRQEFGRLHLSLGDGSLAARLMRCPLSPQTYADDPEFLHALRIVAFAILKHTASQERRTTGFVAPVLADKEAKNGRSKAQGSIG